MSRRLLTLLRLGILVLVGETFLAPVTWEGGRPIVNGGLPLEVAAGLKIFV